MSTRGSKPPKGGRPKKRGGKLSAIEPSGQAIQQQYAHRNKTVTVSSSRLATTSKGRLRTTSRNTTSIEVTENAREPSRVDDEIPVQQIEPPPKKQHPYRRAVVRRFTETISFVNEHLLG